MPVRLHMITGETDSGPRASVKVKHEGAPGIEIVPPCASFAEVDLELQRLEREIAAVRHEARDYFEGQPIERR